MKTNSQWLEIAIQTAALKKGRCLSTEYISAKFPMEWECDKAHRWNAPLDRIKNSKAWCRVCAGVAPSTLEIAVKCAQERNGKCLSTEYISAKFPMEWECDKGHRWLAPLDRIKNSGTWCLECSVRRRHTVKDCQELAISKGGQFLSTEYTDRYAPVRWKCSAGHEWECSFVSASSAWCKKCSGYVPKHSLETAQQKALAKDGKCLSTEYINHKHQMLWECNNGHRWSACLNNIIHGGEDGNGTWCPTCRKKKTRSERQMYEFVASLGIQCEHDKAGVLPSSRLRFDVWIPSQNKAIELDGAYWHNRPDAVERDQRKNKEAAELGIQILRIDHQTEWSRSKRNIGEQKIKEFLGIFETCSKCKINPPAEDRTVCRCCVSEWQNKHKLHRRYPDGQKCIHCRRWSKKAKDLSCKKCREARSVRLCTRCELILPVEAFFYRKEPYCKFCRNLRTK